MTFKSQMRYNNHYAMFWNAKKDIREIKDFCVIMLKKYKEAGK